MSSFVANLYLSIEELMTPLQKRFASLEAVEYLFYGYGWEISLDDATFAKMTPVLAFRAPLEQFLSLAGTLRQQLNASPGASLSVDDVNKLITAGDALIDAVAKLKSSAPPDLAAPLGNEAFWTSIGEQLFDDLLEEFVRVYHPKIYLVLHAAGVIRYDSAQPAGSFRRPYTKIVFDWDQVGALLQDPVSALKQTYGWGGAPGVPLQSKRLFEVLAAVLRAVNIPTRRVAASLRGAANTLPEDTRYKVDTGADGLRAALLEGFSPRDQVVYEVGLELFASSRVPDTVTRGLILSPVLRGGAGGELPLGDSLVLRWTTGASADDVLGVAMFPEGFDLVEGAPVLGASVEIAYTGTDPMYLVGDANSARIEVYGASLRFSVEGAANDPEVKLHLTTKGAGGQPGCKVVVPLDEADAFVRDAVRQNSMEFSFSPEVVWSNKSGLTFNGNAKLSVTLPLAIGVGPVTLTQATLAAHAQPTPPGGWVLEAGAGLVGKLGPVTFTVDTMGLACTVTPVKRADVLVRASGTHPPALGALDVQLHFAPPKGLGISVDAAVVTGGGFLGHTGDEYSGALDLTVGEFAVKAYGVVATRLPGGVPGYSFIVALSAEFTPEIELPFGFSLKGIGGLMGINRTVSVDAVEAALWGHRLDGLLFPKDPIAAAPQLMAALDSYFPAARGRYLLGPLAKIGWGNGIVVGELALLVELPEPLRVFLLGEIQVGVPQREPQLELHISFAGGLDFGKKLAFFDATLHDSRIESYPISGDLAFRYGWGGDGVFALGIGGFNPHFQAPAAFPALKRLSLTIASGVAQLQAQAYFALTSNTLQFGARVELTAGTGSFNVHGWLGFDALCQRHPLAFQFDLSAGVDLRHGTSVLASVHLDGHLSGPNPWHIAGEASLSLLFFDVTVHFDKTWGREGGALPAPDPLPLLMAALGDRSAFSGVLVAGVRAVAAIITAPADAGQAVLLDPAASLRIAQRVLPLGQPITRFGGAPLGRTLQVSVEWLSAFGSAITNPDTVTEEFAPAQYFELSDAEKLSLPSFGRFAAGVEIGADAIDVGRGTRSRAVITPVVYDTTIVDSPTVKRPGSRYALDASLMAKMSGSAGGGRGLGRYAPRPGARAALDLQPDRWVVAGVIDLRLRADIGGDGSKLGAQLALRRFLAENPDQQGHLQIVLAGEGV